MVSLANFNNRPEALACYYATVTLADGVGQETCHFFLVTVLENTLTEE